MLLSEEVEVRWAGNNINHYTSLGYTYTKTGNQFKCKVKDLMPSSEYIVSVKCDYCGKEFTKQYKKYKTQRNIVAKDACKDCAGKKNTEIKMTKYGTLSCAIHGDWLIKHQERFREIKDNIWNQIQSIFKERDYTLLSESYTKNNDYIYYICNKHQDYGIQRIDWAHLQNDRGCMLCGIERRANEQRFSYDKVKYIIEEEFKSDNCKLHSDTYNGYNVYDLDIECRCGEHFTTNLDWFVRGKRHCNICTASKGEKAVNKFLNDNYIDFIHQYKFDDCAYKDKLKFDFYLTSLHIAIEYDGAQHYFPVCFNGISYELAEKIYQENIIKDNIKNDYCSSNNIKLIRIPYWQFDNIDNILTKELNL